MDLDKALSAEAGLNVRPRAPLSHYTRFGIGGAADLMVEAWNEAALITALQLVRESGLPHTIIGDGTNLIVADAGYRGVAIRYRGSAIEIDNRVVQVRAGTVLQALVDATIAHGLSRIHTMTGIPGSVGAAIYGNAGAYGHSISESVLSVRYFDGESIRTCTNKECEFRYRESIFKFRKEWVILSASLALVPGDPVELRKAADNIRKIRDEKYPPTMRCAGSIFKNLILAELPEAARLIVPAQVVKEGKVPSAWFLEQAGVKGLRIGGAQVAEYHANLIYNDGSGTAAELRQIIGICKDRVRAKFGFVLEEEVQYVGFEPGPV
jgi:UDP-N-acetylmuramate dehydrogenase